MKRIHQFLINSSNRLSVRLKRGIAMVALAALVGANLQLELQKFSSPPRAMAQDAAQCGDGVDNDGDGLYDMQDSGCSSDSDNSEFNATSNNDSNANGNGGNVIVDNGNNNNNNSNNTNVVVNQEPSTQCNDGADNDSDGYTDFPNDPGCASLIDNNEFNVAPTSSAAPVQTACNDNADNDGDGLYDMQDPGCSSTSDNSEFNAAPSAQCNDGSDNDGDYLIDYPNDPGCTSPTDTNEYNAPVTHQCNDGADNDADGLKDYPNDPGCSSATDDSEFNAVASSAPATTQCNDGSDNDGDYLVDYPNDPGCTSANDNSEFNAVVASSSTPVSTQCNDGADNDHDNLVDFPYDPGCASPTDNDEFNAVVASSSTPVHTQCNDGSDNDGDYLVDYPNDPGCTGPTDNNEYNASSSSTPTTFTFQCNDGADNDHDNLVDFPYDPGCASPVDNDEFNITTTSSVPVRTQCNDGADNDGDYLIDYPNDPGCTGPTDNNEYNASSSSTSTSLTYQCSDGADNDHDNLVDFPNDPGCSSPTDNDEFNIVIPSSSSSSTNLTYQCSDGADNDHDNLVDFPNDPGCSSPTDNDEFNIVTPSSSSSSTNLTYQCSDGADNDHDNLVDFPNDPGCSSPTDNDEFNIVIPSSSSSSTNLTYQCSDGADNDHDNLVDYPNDPGCTGPTDNDEFNIPTSADLSIVKTGPSVALRGTSFAYIIRVTNNGPASAQNVVVNDTFPVGLVYNTSLSDSRCSLQGGTVACFLGTMTAGTQTLSLSFSVPSLPLCYNTTITNTATVSSTTADTVTINNASSWQTGLSCPDISSSSSSSSLSNSSSSVTTNTDMTIQKTGPATAVFGQNLTYNISVRNNGTVAATNVHVVDPVPAGLIFNQALSTTGCLQQGASVYCGLGNVQANETRSVTLVFGTSIPTFCQNGTIQNTAFVTNDNNSNAGNDTSTVVTAITCPVISSSSSSSSSVNGNTDMTIQKTGPATAVFGQNLTYNISVRNNGTVAATNVHIVDPVPAGLTFNQSLSTTGCLQQGASVYCGLGNIAASETRSVTLVFGTSAPTFCQNGTIQNTAFVTNDNNSNAGNDTSTVVTTLTCPTSSSSSSSSTPTNNADVTITKTISAPTTAPLGTVHYMLSAHNNGPDAAQNVIATDTVPAGLIFLSSASDSRCSMQGNTVSCTLGTLANNQTIALGLTFSIPATAACNGTIVNNASVTTTSIDQNMGNNQASAQVVVICGSSSSSSSSSTPTNTTDLAILKTANPQSVTVGSQTIFTINVYNNGPQTANGVTVSDILPSGLTFVNAVTTAGTYTNGQWTIGTLNTGATAMMQITATVNIVGSITNTATVTSQTPDANSTNNTASATVIGIQQQAQTGCIDILKQTYSPQGNPFSMIAPFIFNLDGNQTSVVNDSSGHAKFTNIPVGVHNVSEVVTPGWTQTSVFPQNGLVTVFASENNATCSPITFQNKLNATSSSSSSSSSSDNTADLSITKTANPSVVSVGANTVFTVTVHNNSNLNAQNVIVNDPMPSGLSYISSVTTSGNYSGSQWNIGTLIANGTATLQITAAVNVNGSVTNTATVSASTPDNNSGNNTASATVSGTQQNGCIDIYKIATDRNGNQIYSVPSFTFSLDNNRTTSNDSSGHARFDNVPTGTHTISEYNQNGWRMESMNPSNGNVTVVNGSCVTVNIRNRQTDDNNNGNTFTISKTDGRSTVHPGDRLTYTITVRNNNSSNQNNVTVRDTLPNYLRAISASDNGRINGRTVTWNNISMAGYSTRTFRLDVEVDDDARGTLTNRAEVNGRVAYDTDVVDENGTSNGNLDLTKDASTSEVFPGGMIEYTVRIRNNSDTTMRNIHVTDDLPSNITVIDDGNSDGGNNDRLEWDIGSLSPNASRVIRYRISIGNSYGVGSFVRNDAEATADNGDTEHASSIVQVIGNLPQTGFMNADLTGNSIALRPITGGASGSGEIPAMFWIALAGLTTGTGAGFLRKFITGV